MLRLARLPRLSAFLVLLLAGSAVVAIRAQSPAALADQLIQQSSVAGERYLATRDKAAGKTSRDGLEKAESMLRAALKRDPGCEVCAAGMVAAGFYKAAFGFTRGYEDVIALAHEGLKRYPANSRIAFFKGYAHYNRGEFGDAVRALSRFSSSPSADPGLLGAASPIQQDAQGRFLSSWWKQSDFYQSKDARVERVDPRTFKKEVLFQFTPEWELNAGNEALGAITQKAKRVEDPETRAYVETIVTRLVARSPGPSFAYKVTVVDSPDVNALTPPGHIIVFTGLLKFVESEAQLAAVLSHELAHNYAHHSARRVLKAQQGQSVATAILKVVEPKSDMGRTIATLTTKLGLGLFLNAYSRREEQEADLYGAHILFNGGFNPTELSGLFARMYEANPRQPIKFLSTHPPLPDRVVYLTDYLEAFPLAMETKLTSEPFTKLKARYASAPDVRRGRGGTTAHPALPPSGGGRTIPSIPPAAEVLPLPRVSPPRAAPPPVTAPPPPAMPPAVAVPPPEEAVKPAVLPPLSVPTGMPAGEVPPVPLPRQAAVAELPLADLMPTGLVATRAGGCSGFDGRWVTPLGVMILRVTGSEAIGTYPRGEITGRVEERSLSGRWQAYAAADGTVGESGALSVSLGADLSFSGTWTAEATGMTSGLTGRCLSARQP